MHLGPHDLQDPHQHHQQQQQQQHHNNSLHAQQQQQQQQQQQHLQQQQQHHNLNMPGHNSTQQQLDLDAQHMLPQSMDADYNGLGKFMPTHHLGKVVVRKGRGSSSAFPMTRQSNFKTL